MQSVLTVLALRAHRVRVLWNSSLLHEFIKEVDINVNSVAVDRLTLHIKIKQDQKRQTENSSFSLHLSTTMVLDNQQ